VAYRFFLTKKDFVANHYINGVAFFPMTALKRRLGKLAAPVQNRRVMEGNATYRELIGK
jgi:hypothetical protein